MGSMKSTSQPLQRLKVKVASEVKYSMSRAWA